MSSPKHEFHVPGAYHFDNPPSFTARALGADVFLPPVASASSPADSTTFDLTKSAGSLYSDFSTVAHPGVIDHGAKRKRPAQDSRETTPLAEWDASTVNGQSHRDIRRLPHQAPNGTAAYTLGSQDDTYGRPTQHNGLDESVVYSDVDYRRALGPADDTTLNRPSADPTDPEKWNVLHALGNVVGKVWEFCTTGAFRGFHAGGGAGYDWETGKPTNDGEHGTVEPANAPVNELSEKSLSLYAATEAPSNADSDRESTPQRNGKRRQVSAGRGDELGRNWVIVDSKQRRAQTQSVSSAHTTPRRPAAKPPLRSGRASTSATPVPSTRTPDRRAPSYTRGATTATPGTAASRRINTPISRMGPSNTANTPQTRRGASGASAARISHAGSPSLSSREPASFASPRSSTPVGGATIASPRRQYASATYNSPGGSRIPQPGGGGNEYNPFSRVAAGSPRPGSRAGGGRSSSTAFGAGSPIQKQQNGHGRGHRRSYSGRVGMSPLPKKASMSNLAMGDEGAPLDITESPRLNDEAKRLAAQNLAAEQESDAKMEAFNLRLQQMIRQGQEALGTTFEVDGDDDAGGDDYWADD